MDAIANTPGAFLPFDPTPAADRKVELLRGSEIQPQPIAWLWDGYLARGKLHIIAGAPGSGKTTLALRLAATVTTGGRWPDGSRCSPGNVVIWSGEDDIRDTLTPRLIAAGADMSRVFFVGDVREEKGSRTFDPAKDVPALEKAIVEAGGAALVLVDPVVSAVQGDGHKSNDVRRGLQPLVDLASNMLAALVGISHFSKGTSGRDPLERVTGSVAFGAVARLVFVTAKEQRDEDSELPPRRMFVRAKSNIGHDGGGFEYALAQAEVDKVPGMFASVVNLGPAVDGEARTILAVAETEPESDGGALGEARDWLVDFLVDGAKPVKAIRAAATEAGHSWATIRRAKKPAGVLVRKSGMEGAWEWGLPTSEA